MSLNVAEPGSTPTPFSKKHPPPNDSPMRSGFDAASANAAGSVAPFWPFQSDHSAGSTVAVTVPTPGAVRNAEAGFDHQYFVYANGPFAVLKYRRVFAGVPQGLSAVPSPQYVKTPAPAIANVAVIVLPRIDDPDEPLAFMARSASSGVRENVNSAIDPVPAGAG